MPAKKPATEKQVPKNAPGRTVMLIDGNSLTYRAFFALPTDMATASGQVTNAVFGFTSMLINLLRDHTPELIAVSPRFSNVKSKRDELVPQQGHPAKDPTVSSTPE